MNRRRPGLLFLKRVVAAGRRRAATPLTGPRPIAVWTITVKDKATSTALAFVNFPRPCRAPTINDDLFVIGAADPPGPEGSTGGAGPASIRWIGRGASAPSNTWPSGPHSGTVTRDGVTLSNVRGWSRSTTCRRVDHRIINLSGGSDDAVLTQTPTALMAIATCGHPHLSRRSHFLGGQRSARTINLGWRQRAPLLTDRDRWWCAPGWTMGSRTCPIPRPMTGHRHGGRSRARRGAPDHRDVTDHAEPGFRSWAASAATRRACLDHPCGRGRRTTANIPLPITPLEGVAQTTSCAGFSLAGAPGVRWT